MNPTSQPNQVSSRPPLNEILGTTNTSRPPIGDILSGKTTAPVQQPKQTSQPSYFDQVKNDVGTDINTRVNKVGDILGRNTNPVTKGLQIFGQGEGMAANALEKTVGNIPGIKQAAGVAGKVIDWLANSDYSAIHEAAKTYGKLPGLDTLVKLYDTDPNFKDTVDAVGNTVRLAGDVQAGVDVGTSAVNKIGNIVNPTPSGSASTAEIGADGKTVAPTDKSLIDGGSILSGIKNKAEDIMNAIPKNVETVLKETPPEKLNEYIDTANKAKVNSKNITPLELAGQKATEALDTIQSKLSKIGEAKQKFMDTMSMAKTKVGPIVIKYRQALNTALQDETLVTGDKNLLDRVITESQKLGDNPTARKVDKFIDYVQNEIYTGGKNLSIPVTDKITGTLRRVTGYLNEALKSQLPSEYRSLNQQYSDLVNVRNELNTKLGPGAERAGSLMKRVFSPSDANTKQLFEQVKQETGVDLTNEAVLAKYVMETVGDARQRSLLEQTLGKTGIPTSKSGVIGAAINKVTGLVENPEANFRKALRITQTGGETTPSTNL